MTVNEGLIQGRKSEHYRAYRDLIRGWGRGVCACVYVPVLLTMRERPRDPQRPIAAPP